MTDENSLGLHALAERAAEWWKTQLSKSPDPGDSAISDLFWLAKCQADRPAESQLDDFRSILANRIIDEIKKYPTPQFVMKIKVDYDACPILSQAAEQAGIDKIHFPIKTIMCISPGRIETACGYGKAWEKII